MGFCVRRDLRDAGQGKSHAVFSSVPVVLVVVCVNGMKSISSPAAKTVDVGEQELVICILVSIYRSKRGRR